MTSGVSLPAGKLFVIALPDALGNRNSLTSGALEGQVKGDVLVHG